MDTTETEVLWEADLGDIDSLTVEVLRKVVDKLEGKAELLYKEGRWLFRIYTAARIPPVKKKRKFRKPAPDKEFIASAVAEVLKETPEIAEDYIEVLRRVRSKAREAGFRPIVPPTVVRKLLREHVEA